MFLYSVKCPHCGKLNRFLNLEETNGWMECDGCKEVSQVVDFTKERLMPVIRLDQLDAFIKATSLH